MPIYSIKAGVTRLKAAEQVNKWTICQAGHSTLLVLLKKNERESEWEREKQKNKGAQKGPCFTYKKTRSSQASVTEKQWKWMNTGVSGVITKSKGVFFLDYTLKCVGKETQSFWFLFNTLICLEPTLDFKK